MPIRVSGPITAKLLWSKSGSVDPAVVRGRIAFLPGEISFWSYQGEAKRAVSFKAQKRFKQRIRECTRRSGGRSMQQVVNGLRPYLLGWKAYFGLSQAPRVWRELDEWIRHRLRAIQLKHWKRGTTIYKELRATRVAGGATVVWK
jgi:hypothetical protein